ncbi:hypothetical protein [Williamsia sp. 1135]|uniref:hypothetical protein n=1 Tax=Williamsia sp. 1135 TaxID=1889262 RepID=UPI000A1058D9|nr:hypothetical protein [Williamsia sp. 1135]ORM29194.1 hypothetical protein BFL43_20385 [Williamsia sp. 1135]
MANLAAWAPAQKRVASIQDELNKKLDTIRDDRRYSEAGRESLMARAVIEAKQRVNQMRNEAVTERENSRRDLQRRLFGISGNPDPQSMIALRDAQDRADQLENIEAAQRVYNRASESGDTYLAQAVAQVAVRKGWRDVVDAFSTDTGQSELLEQLSDLPTGDGVNLADTSVFRVSKPRELATCSDIRLEFLAKQTDDDGDSSDDGSE